MRILHYIQEVDFRNGGPPRAVVDQVATMHARGHAAGLATTVTRDVPTAWMQPRDSTDSLPDVVRLPPTGGPLRRLSRAGVRCIASAVRDSDVVHLHGVWEPGNLQVAAACRAAGTPYVVSLRGMLDDWSMAQSSIRKRIYLAFGGRKYLESAAAVHCTADAELAQSHQWFPRGRGAVVPNLIDLDPYVQRPDPATATATWSALASGDPVALFLSRVQYKKGVEHLVDAASLLRDRGRRLHVVIAGSGDDEYVSAIRQRIESKGLGDGFTWTGHVGGALKLSLYAAADVFVLPTSQENFGFVFFEAMAAGTPVITTDLVDTRDEIERSGGGLVVPQTAEAFADAIESFIDGRHDRDRMGEAGRVWTLEHLATDRVAGEFERLYESCLAD